MVILSAHKYYFRGGGTATYLFTVTRELEARGHQVIPFTVAYAQTEAPREYERFWVSPPTADAASTHFRHLRRTPANALRLLGRATYSLEARRKAASLIAEAGVELAYLHNVYNYMSPSLIHACRDAGVPVVMRVADYNLLCPEYSCFRRGRPCTACVGRGYLQALPRRCVKGSLAATAARVFSMYVHRWLRIYQHIQRFITPSRFMRDLMIQGGFPPDRITHVPSCYEAGADAQSLSTRPRTHLLYFGRVSPEKGLDVLIRALALLRPEVELLIAGGDRQGETQRLQALCAQLGLEQVRFLGHCSREQVEELVAGALFTVFPSRWYDNCPMAILESYAQGTPVLAARIGGIPEQVDEGTGWLFEPGDPEDLARQMKAALAQPALLASQGAAAREKIRTVYSVARHVSELERLFAEAVSPRPGT